MVIIPPVRHKFIKRGRECLVIMEDSADGSCISALSIVKKFQGKTALNNLNIRVECGQRVALLGPNGAGKSTALKIISGILKPDYGEARIRGNISTGAEAKKMLGYLPEDASPYPMLSVRENMDYIGAIRSTEGLDDRIEELLDILALREYETYKVSALSRGNRQKLAVALSIIHRPEVMVMDEPLNYLDIPTQESLISMFRKMNGTFLVSTHIMSIAERLTERIIIISRGQEIWHGSTSDLKAMGKEKDTIEEIVSRMMVNVSNNS